MYLTNPEEDLKQRKGLALLQVLEAFHLQKIFLRDQRSDKLAVAELTSLEEVKTITTYS